MNPARNPIAVAGETALGALRRTTASRHALLESVLQLVEPLPRLRYATALQGFDLFLSVWEPRLAAALPVPLRAGFAARSRHALLLDDRALLGAAAPLAPELVAVCTHAAQSIELPDAAASYGSMYVMEGSALGGQVIAKIARNALGLGPHTGAAYFSGSLQHTVARWNEFRAQLEQQVGETATPRTSACTAARQTFDALIYTFAILRARTDVA